MRRPKIVQVITRLVLGGAQLNTILSCEGLAGAFDMVLVTGPGLGPEGDMMDRARRGAYRLHVIPWLRRNLHPVYDVLAFVALWWFFVRERPDIVHTHSAKAGILGRLAARLAGVRIVLHTIHGVSWHEHQSAFVNNLFKLCEWLCGRLSNALVCVGEEMKKKSRRLHRNIRVIYNGFEVEKFVTHDRAAMRRKYGLPQDGVVLTMVSRLAPLKGHEQLLEAHRRLPGNVVLCLVGDGELRPQLEAKADPRVRFLGRVPPEAVPEILAATDIVVHTSFREGLPRVCVEALLCGRPVVGFDVDGTREVVLDGITGRLVRPPTVEALVEALTDLIADPKKAAEMGEEGKRRVRAQFDRRKMVLDLERLYLDLLGGRC